MKRLKRRILAGLLAFVMCISTVNVTAFAQENETSSEIQETVAVSETGSSNEASTENIEITDTAVSGNNVEPVEEKLLNENQEQLTNEKIYENENYNVTFSLTSSWESGYNANVKIENTGDDTIQNWYLSFEYDDQITNIWNADISTHEENQYIVKNAGWNQDIVAGGSIEFGISGSTAFNEFPENFNVVGENKEVQEEDYSVHYQVDSDWGSGFTGSIQITNNTDKILEDWVLEFDFEREITNIWNAVIECHEGNHYVIRNAGYNANINAGQMVSFGFNGMNGSKDIVPENNKLYSYEASIEIDLNLDSDNDGAEDYIEDYFGTDKKKEDTDGDGLSDYIEIFIIGSEPTIIDTDQNGINDGDEDADQDGLSNLSEVEIGTDLIKIDTDSDGLSDYEEKNTYQTNSLEYDTDQDNVSDGTEIELGTNPLVYDENFDLCITATDEDTVKVSVEMNLSGVQVETLSVEKYENEFFFPTSMPGYIGGAYDFSVDGEFDKATINFEFDEILLEDSSFDPVIYYFNEEKQLLEELETTVSGNVASAQVTHFSKYILLNRKVFQSAFEWQDVWSTTGYTGVEIVLVIDDSGSLGGDYSYNATTGIFTGGEDPEHKRLEVARNFVDNANASAKIGIVKFDGVIDNISNGLIECNQAGKDILKDYLQFTYVNSGSYNINGIFDSRGYTYMYGGIEMAMNQFSKDSEDTLKALVVFTDGQAHDISKHSSVISTANNNGVKIYTVGLGGSSTYFTNYLQPLAQNTGGAFYLASNANELTDIYNDINEKIDIETDSDGDGITDYYEDNMVMFNGVTLALDKNNPDTDNDGVLDGKEVCELKYEYNSDKTKVIVTGKLISSPLEPDSDYDGKPDSTDKAPLNNHFTGTLTTEYATSNIAFDMDYRWFFNDNNIYCEDLSITSSLFASAIYQPNSLSIIDSEKMDTTSGTSMSDIMNYFGMSNTKTIELKDTYNDIHVSEVGVGYRTVSYNGENKNIIAVVVRGTNGTIDEWSSNFEIGKLGDFESEVDWINVDNHMGFDIAANRIINIVSQYVSDNQLEMNECAYWITGHSRGAAIANIIGAYYENEQKRAYTYTYAAPNTTMNADASDYKTIFNVVNADDFVPCLPMTSWGYTRYGKTASISFSANYEKEWENLTGIWDYNPDTYGMQDTVDALGDIIASGDAREEVYKYTCNCHGDNSIDTITVTNYGISKDSREKAIAKIPSNALPYCTITRYDGWLVGGWNFDNCQTPAYFMQILAAQMSGELTKKQFVVDINIAKRYENAKTAVIKSAIGGLSHPHYTESYYILSNNLTNGAFK